MMATILLVEDNEDLRDMMSVALELGGHVVWPAGNGREALQILHLRQHPDLILADLMMPVMDGWELRAAIKADPSLSTIPLLVVSAVSPEIDRALGSTGYLAKPVDLDVLLDVVSSYGHGHQLSGRTSHP
jgi:CheY-like chemotaxis protein